LGNVLKDTACVEPYVFISIAEESLSLTFKSLGLHSIASQNKL